MTIRRWLGDVGLDDLVLRTRRRCKHPEVCTLAARILEACDDVSESVWQDGGTVEAVDVYVTPFDQFTLRVHHIDRKGNEQTLERRIQKADR